MTCMAFDRSKRCLYTGGEAGRGIERLGVPGKSRRPRRLVLTVCRKGLSNFGISLPDSSGALGTWQAIRHTYSGTEQPLGCSQSFSILGAMICLRYSYVTMLFRVASQFHRSSLHMSPEIAHVHHEAAGRDPQPGP